MITSDTCCVAVVSAYDMFMVQAGLGIFFASFCRNRVGENLVKRKFQASNLEPFKTLIGARFHFERNWASDIRIHDEFI